MYYYLSFLRPPPTESLPAIPISITPQITNDLRTEFFEESIDILYCWTLIGTGSTSSTPIKLTTWKGSPSAYKAVSIQLPASARPGQKYRLSIFCSPHNSPSIPLGRVYSQPYGASSLPVNILAPKGSPDDIPKQDEIERYLSFPIIAEEGRISGSRSLVIRERTSFDLDKKVWDSGVALAGWLCKTLAGNATSAGGRLLLNTVKDAKPCHVIELGAGTGLVAITVFALLFSRRHVSITVTDLESAIPLLEHNIHQNRAYSGGVNIVAAVLDWEEDLPQHVKSAGPFELILMSDVTYNTASFPALLKTIKALRSLSQEGNTETLVLLAYKERDPGEREVWDMMGKDDITFEKIDEVSGHGGQPVELWLAKLHKRVEEAMAEAQ